MTDAKQGQLQVKATVFLWVEVLKLAVSIQTKALAESRKISYSKYYLPLKLGMCSEDHESVRETMIRQT